MRSIFSTSLILAGFLFSCSAVSGQNKFAFSATVAPFYGHNKSKVIIPVDDGSGTFPLQEWKSESSPKGYWIGLNGRYSFSRKWSASTGLWFSESWLKPSNISRSHNFSIPVMVNFQTSEKKLSPYFSAGASWNLVTTSRVYVPGVGTVTFKSDNNNISRILPMIGAGAVYHFAPHLSLIAQPTFSYSIPPSGYNSHAYQLSLNMQLMLKL